MNLPSMLSTLPSPAGLLAAALTVAAPALAQHTPQAIAVRTQPAAEGGTTVEVSGPPSAQGLLVVGTATRATPRPLRTQGGLLLQVGLEPRAVIPFETDAGGRWSTVTAALPEDLRAQALFPGLGASSAGLGFGATPPGVGFSSVTPVASCPQPVKPGDLVITEIQRDPREVLDSDGEWFELRNTTLCDIDIEGWRITDEAGDFHFLGTGLGVIVPAGGTLVLGRNADPALNGGVSVGYEYANFSLDEIADRIVLLDGLGAEMERVEWDASWPANEEGRALSLEPGTGAASNDLPGSWCLASAPVHPTGFLDFGTPGAANPSCACTGQEDLPDAGYVDSNCDGIDGDRSRAVFVAESGSPTGQGTIVDPVDSIGAALALAAADPALDHVYVSKGLYAESVQLVDGVSIWGGYDVAAGWTRAASNLTTIAWAGAPQPGNVVVALSGNGLAQPIVVGDLEVSAGNAGASAGSSIFAARLHHVADLRLERVHLVAASGRNAASGAAGSGYATSSYSGGSGGAGGAIFSDGKSGFWGSGPGGSPGSGGNYPGNGGSGGNGSTGSNGAQGGGATSALPTLAGGLWSVPNGTGKNGGNGTAGGGGGGGGGGSGGVIFAGGDGGRGGNGGRGGSGGQGAGPGGTSAALVVSSSQVELADCVLESGAGGQGGSGGVYSGGQSGQTGSSGQSGSSYGYAGGKGGRGGNGGRGGYGGGGAGGSSFGIVVGQLAGVTQTGSTTILPGAAGIGGAPVASGAVAGLSAAVQTVPE